MSRTNVRQSWAVDEIAGSLKLEWFDYQLDCFDHVTTQENIGNEHWRLCLYYRTGAGKSFTALTSLAITGWSRAVVIAPPSTHPQWEVAGSLLGIEVLCMSHAKFRMADTKLDRAVPVIADEFHMFGGHKGKGWTKLDRLSKGLKAPMVLLSATPNYNDAERVYCVQKILDPGSTTRGFMDFVYANCITEQNPFGVMPNVIGFQRYPDAESYLADMKGVLYLPDETDYTIVDHHFPEKIPPEMTEFGIDLRHKRMIASGMEFRHKRIILSLTGQDHRVRDEVFWWIRKYWPLGEKILIYTNHDIVGQALTRSLEDHNQNHLYISGNDTAKAKAEKLQAFLSDPDIGILVGTAALATGTDGIDKVCDTLLIVDDTDDDALRRQLIGRIMPRGADSDASMKQVHRIVLT